MSIKFIEGVDRKQTFLFQETLDDIIVCNNKVRFIDAYVEKLNLKKLGFKIKTSKKGAPAYRSELLLKLYLYGYLEKIRTSRKLEKEAKRNVELKWLLEDLTPDFKTIADFRKDNKNAFKNVFKSFLTFSYKLNLITLDLVAGDGSKIRAQNSNNEIYHRETIQKVEELLDKKINEYYEELNANDKREKEEIKFDENKILEAVKKLETKKEKVNTIKKIFEENEDLKTYFATDEDSRFQKDNGRVNAGYNVQTIVDDKNKLIVSADVTNESNDFNQLPSIVDKVKNIKEDLNVKNITDIVADAGYYSEKNIMAVKEEKEVNVYVQNAKEAKKINFKIKNKPNKKNKKEGIFPKEDFQYVEEKDKVICPQGKELSRENKKTLRKSNNQLINTYRCIYYKKCLQREKCSKSKSGRLIEISLNHVEMELYNEKMKEKESKEILRKRKEIVEHPFGTIKHTMGYRYFLLKGLEKVKGEFNLICLTYNIKRILNLFKVDELIELVERCA